MKTAISECLDSMLKENTGIHMLDSGGSSSRHWQQNQGKDFEAQKPTRLDIQIRSCNRKPTLEINITHNIYHWLKDRVIPSKEGNQALKACARFIRASNWKNGHRESELDVGPGYKWVERNGALPSTMELMMAFPDFFAVWLARHNQADLNDRADDETGEITKRYTSEIRWPPEMNSLFVSKSPYDVTYPGGGQDAPRYPTYTYNEQNLLSQDIQFTAFEIDYNEYVILQVHGGADARGGLTAPQVFESNSSCSEWRILDYGRATVYCTDEGKHTETNLTLPGMPVDVGRVDPNEYHSWSTTDGGYRLEANNGECGDFSKLDLVIVDEANFMEVLKGLDCEGLPSEPVTVTDTDGLVYAKAWVEGMFCVDNNRHIGMCPHCGGELAAAAD